MATEPPVADAASPCMMERLRNTQGTRLKNDENLARFRDFGKLSEWPRRKFASFAWRKTGVFDTLGVMDMEQNVAGCHVTVFSAVVSSCVILQGVSGCMIQRGFVLKLTETSARSAEPHDLQLRDVDSRTIGISLFRHETVSRQMRPPTLYFFAHAVGGSIWTKNSKRCCLC